jgi:hypothetical protein
MRHNPAQNPVFLDAFPGRLEIPDHIPAAAVQQPVIATGRSVVQITFFNQNGADTSHGKIPNRPGTGCASTNHQNFRLNMTHELYFLMVIFLEFNHNISLEEDKTLRNVRRI